MDYLVLLFWAGKITAYAVFLKLFLSCSYKYLLHPLRNFPGPFVAKFSDGYGAFLALSRNVHLATFENHRKYGSVFRHGPNKLVFNSANALHDIYQNTRVTKTKSYLVTLHDDYDIFNVNDRQLHRMKRKRIGQAVTDQSMRRFEPTMREQIDLFLEELNQASKNSSPVDMTNKCKLLGLDIAGRLAFGYGLDLQTNPANRFLIPGMVGENHLHNMLMQFPLLTPIKKIVYFINQAPLRRSKVILDRLIASRLAEDKDAKHDLYSVTADYLSPTDIFREAIFFLPAAGDTVSTAMATMFFYLSRYPSCRERLAKEIRSTFTDNAHIQGGSQLSSCAYLRACIDETLRISPPVPGILWREIADDDDSDEPFIVDGHLIPPGTQVGVSSYCLHHNEAYFPEPFVFKPERWLGSDQADSEEQLARKKMVSAFCPFSTGARGCAGKAMAYLEISLVAARTLWAFDFDPAPGRLGEIGAGQKGKKGGRGRIIEFQLYDIFASYHEGPFLVFHPRKHP